MSTQLPTKCGACSSCTNSKKQMTTEQQATVYSFNIKREENRIKSLSREEKDKYYIQKANQQEFRYSLFLNPNPKHKFNRF
jgi:hypothetical protein